MHPASSLMTIPTAGTSCSCAPIPTGAGRGHIGFLRSLMRTSPNQSIICCTSLPVKRTRLWCFLHDDFLLLQGLLVAVVLSLHNFPKVCFTALDFYHHSPDVGIAWINQSNVSYLTIDNLCYFYVTFRSPKSLVSRQMLFTSIHQSCLGSVFGSPFQIRNLDKRQT